MVVKTKKVARNNKNKVGGSSPRTKSSASNKVLVISKVNEKLPTYFKESLDKVKKLLTVGNKIIGLKTTYADASRLNSLTPTNKANFISKFQSAANLAGEPGLKRIMVTLTIEENLVTNPSDELPANPKSRSKSSVTNPNDDLPASPNSNDTAKKLQQLVQIALQKKQKSYGTLTLNMDKLKEYPKYGTGFKALKFHFTDDAGFDVKEEIIIDIGKGKTTPKKANSEPGPRRRSSRRRTRRNISSTKSAG